MLQYYYYGNNSSMTRRAPAHLGLCECRAKHPHGLHRPRARAQASHETFEYNSKPHTVKYCTWCYDAPQSAAARAEEAVAPPRRAMPAHPAVPVSSPGPCSHAVPDRYTRACSRVGTRLVSQFSPSRGGVSVEIVPTGPVPGTSAPGFRARAVTRRHVAHRLRAVELLALELQGRGRLRRCLRG